MRSRIASCWWCAVLAMLLVACSVRTESNVGSRQTEREELQLLELFSWWKAPGEAEALQALLQTHQERRPSARVFNAAVASGMDARLEFEQRIERNLPPDVFQGNAHDMRAFVKRNPTKLRYLDDFFAAEGLSAVLLPEIIDDVTIDDHIAYVPVNMHRENALFYNKKIFDAYGLEPPGNVEELLRVCRTLKAAKVTPIATSYQGWILRIMFNSLVMGRIGGEAYYQYFTGESSDIPKGFADGVELFGTVLRDYVNVDAEEEGFGWTSAAEALHAGDAAMFFHGDWVKGYLVQLGAVPGVDFDVVAAPGAQDMFLYGVDAFAVPHDAVNEKGALSFLQTVVSAEGQLAFNSLKGSSPIRMGLDRRQFDPSARRTLADLESARYRMIVRSRQVWDDALVVYSRTGEVEPLVQTYRDHPPPH